MHSETEPDTNKETVELTPAEKRWGPFAYRSYTLYWLSRFFGSFAVQIVSVAVGWLVYDLTRSPLMLGLVGLVQFLPALLLVLVTGQAADRYSRRWIMAACLFAELGVAAVLLSVGVSSDPVVWVIFVALTFMGIARAFQGPATQALAPNLIPTHMLARAIAFNSSSWQVATIVGPVAGGLLYGLSVGAALGTAIALFGIASILIVLVPQPSRCQRQATTDWTAVIAGFRYVWHHKIVLGAISLDLFAVLMAGATALLPAYARDILEVGPWGLGLLRAAPGIGAVAVALFLAIRPINSNAGAWMFICVALFGLATAAFGLSTSPWLSIVLLMIVGATDMCSVYVRETLIQLATPDHVRGRVNAVNMVFIGASNELGEARAGLSGHVIGIVPAVVSGGIITFFIAGLWAKLFPDLRNAQRLDQPLTDYAPDEK